MQVYTVGQVAKIIDAAPRTVVKWFDSGQLKGYRLPGSKDRRIPKHYLLQFMKEHGMPADGIPGKEILFSNNKGLIEEAKSVNARIKVVNSVFLLGLNLEAETSKVYIDSSHEDATKISEYLAKFCPSTAITMLG